MAESLTQVVERFEKLLKGIESNKGFKTPELVFIISSSYLMRARLLARLLRSYKVAASDLEIVKIQPCDLKDELSQYRLFSDQIVLLVETDDYSCFEDKPLKIPDNGPAVVFASSKELPKKLASRYSAETYLFSEPSGPEFVRWVGREFSRLGVKQIPGNLASNLEAAVEGSVDAAYQIISKIALYAGDANVTDEHVAPFLSTTKSVDPYQVMELLLSEKKAAAHHNLTAQLLDGKEPLLLFGLISKSLYNIAFRILMLNAGFKEAEVRTALKVQPWLFNKYIAVSRNLNNRRLGQFYKELALLDSRLKNRSFHAEVLFSKIVEGVDVR